MKMLKKVTLICIILSVFSLSSCFVHKADKNGPDDYSLTEITTEDILDSSENNVTSGCIRIQNGNKCNVKIKKLSGVSVLEKFNLKNANLHLKIDAKVLSGNCRMVLCTKDQILEEIPINSDEQKIMIPQSDDKVYLKVAGESAQIKVTYEYETEESQSYII